MGGHRTDLVAPATGHPGLNPCFGGRCGGTSIIKLLTEKLIAKRLNPCFGGRCGGTLEKEKIGRASGRERV